MSDKLRDVFSIPVDFSAGEMPSPVKLSGFASQTNRAFYVLEHIIGDVWNQSGDSLIQGGGISDYALMIPNIARYLGMSHYLSPRIPALTSITQYHHKALAADVGNYEMLLSLPVSTTTGFTWAGTNAPVGAPKASRVLVVTTGDWYLDLTTGKCEFYDYIQVDWVATYTPTVAGDLGSNAMFNVIPDPETNTSYGFLGCKIAYANNTDDSQGYIIFLPPRGPMPGKRLNRSPQSPYDASSNTANMSADPANIPVLFWQDDTVDATTGTYAEHYRYNVPKLLSDNWSTGSALPTGFLWLWDHSYTGTFIEGVTFTAENVATPRKYVVVAAGTAFETWINSYMDTAYAGAIALAGSRELALKSTSHDPVYYPSTGLRLVTVGTDISFFLYQLHTMFMNHDHSSANSLPGRNVDHGHLKNNFASAQFGLTPRFMGSSLVNDWHPQYLHRGGDQVNTRDGYRNAMLGDLLLASTNSSSNYINNAADSRKLTFGQPSLAGGPSIYYSYDTTGIISDSISFLHKYASNLMGFTIQSANKARCSMFEDGTKNVGMEVDKSGVVYQIELGVLLNTYTPALKVTQDDTEGGSLTVRRCFSQDYTDTTYSTSEGRVRSFVIQPTEFFVYTIDTAGMEGTELEHGTNIDVGDGATTGSVKAYDYDISHGGYAEGFRAFSIFLNRTGVGNNAVAHAYINLPYAQYEIVNLIFAVKPIATPLFDESVFVDIGYSTIYPGWVSPVAQTVDSVNLNNIAAWTGHAAGSFTTLSEIWSAGSFSLEINNDYRSASTIVSKPWIRFRAPGSIDTGADIEISEVTVLYRIKEW